MNVTHDMHSGGMFWKLIRHLRVGYEIWEGGGGNPNDFFPSHELYLHLGLYGASSCYPSYYTQAVVVVVVGGDVAVAVEDDVAVVDVAVVEEDAVVEPDTFPPPSRGSGYDAEREREKDDGEINICIYNLNSSLFNTTKYLVVY